MNAELSLKEIMLQVQKLNKAEQTTLLKTLSSLIKKSDKSDNIKLKQLAGLGAATWHDVNIDKYVDDERQW